MLSGYWHEFTTRDFAAVDAERTVALLPVGAIEQHGPHLPLNTDACINAGIVARVFDHLPDDAGMVVLPDLPVGDSTEHTAFPGTISARPETLIRLWTEIGESVAVAGIAKLILFNTHGGQPQVADIVALDLRKRWGMLVSAANLPGFAVPDGVFDDGELKHGIHGGALETSIMLHLRPDLVRWEEARDFTPLSREMAESYRYLRPHGKLGFGWMAQDLNPAGVVGDATRADSDTGRRIVDHVAQGLARLVAETARFPLRRLRAGPGP